ncbi:MAG: tRNA 2-thiocytidine(32) synthetase TtcA [Francisella sp.]
MTKTEKKLRYYITKAIADYHLLDKGDKVMLCLSGGKDSFGLLKILHGLIKDKVYDIDLYVYTLDQSQPGWDDSKLREYLNNLDVPYEIEKKNTYGVVVEKIPQGKTYCSLCSRLRRGNIYRYAKEHNMDKIILGHHRDDLIQSLLMSIFYQGQIKSMPPKFITQDRENTVIRPMIYVQEKDLITFAKEENFPIIPCNLCGSQENLKRQKVKKLIQDLAMENPKVPSNILNSLANVLPSHLMDKRLFDIDNQ